MKYSIKMHREMVTTFEIEAGNRDTAINMAFAKARNERPMMWKELPLVIEVVDQPLKKARKR